MTRSSSVENIKRSEKPNLPTDVWIDNPFKVQVNFQLTFA